MTTQDLIKDLRSRINLAYDKQIGTESYERRICAEALELLLDEITLLRTQRDYLLSAAQRTLDENRRTNCTMITLTRAVETMEGILK